MAGGIDLTRAKARSMIVMAALFGLPVMVVWLLSEDTTHSKQQPAFLHRGGFVVGELGGD
jgi:hypothetical protein